MSKIYEIMCTNKLNYSLRFTQGVYFKEFKHKTCFSYFTFTFLELHFSSYLVLMLSGRNCNVNSH